MVILVELLTNTLRKRMESFSVKYFLLGIGLLNIISFFFLDIEWGKLISRLPEIPLIFVKLFGFQFHKMDLIFEAILETISVAVLSTFLGVVLGLFFGVLAAENILHIKGLPTFVKSFFSFIRAVPTLVWVLLMLVCLGFGPAAGIVGLCIHTTAFFTRSFAQSFEDVSGEVIEALEATGAGKMQIFFNAILSSSLSQIIAWIGMRFEINFAECAILGMVGAGGIGFMISNSIQSYEYGTAGVAIVLVFVFAYFIERIFVIIKRTLAKND
ncbi:MAG: ABC transporter permease subunit [Eubacterium sp.]|nr:ABC transporter permease subunit [Eubacterium sp.]